MSHHWHNHIMRIGLGKLIRRELQVLVQPGVIEMTLLNRSLLHRLKPRIIKQHLIQSDEVSAVTLAPELLRKLAQSLTSPVWQDAIPTIVLSNAFAHYAVLPWNAQISNKTEHSAYLQHTYMSQFGDASKSWHLSVHEAGFGKASIASGVHKSLLEQLESVFNAAEMPMKAVNPLLMQSTNLALAYLKASKRPQSFWLACVESQRLVLALLVDGDWKSVRNMAAESDLNTQIKTQIQRESVLDASYSQLPILQYGTADIMLPHLMHLPNMLRTDDVVHPILSKWAA